MSAIEEGRSGCLRLRGAIEGGGGGEWVEGCILSG